MTHPAISIIVPVYNAEKELPRCLESLLNQTFPDIEIICVIDGSPDNSLAVCDKYKEKDSRIIVVSQENMGVAGARNTGLANASGEYMQSCDPDDYFEPDMCEKMYNGISGSNADFAAANIRVFFNGVSYMELDYQVKNKGICPVNEAVFRNTDCSLCNKILRKSIIDKYSIDFPQGHVYEDACFLYKYMFVSRTMYCIPEYLYNYIRHGNSIMSDTFSVSSKAIDYMRILENIKAFMIKHKLVNSYEKDLFLWLVAKFVKEAFLYGAKSIHDLIISIASDLLSDIPDEFIQSCPYITVENKMKFMAFQNK